MTPSLSHNPQAQPWGFPSTFGRSLNSGASSASILVRQVAFVRRWVVMETVTSRGTKFWNSIWATRDSLVSSCEPISNQLYGTGSRDLPRDPEKLLRFSRQRLYILAKVENLHVMSENGKMSCHKYRPLYQPRSQLALAIASRRSYPMHDRILDPLGICCPDLVGGSS